MLIQTREQFDTAFTILIDADEVVVDTETYYIQPNKKTMMLGLVAAAKIKGREEYETSFYFPFRHEHDPNLFGTQNLPMEWLKDLKPIFERDEVTLLFHNAKFDIKVGLNDGLNFSAPFYDTMLMSHMADENGTHALKRLGKEIYGISADVEEKKIKEIAKQLGGGKIADGWHKLPPDVMAKYAEKDLVLTASLKDHYLNELERQELLTLWPREEEFCRFLIDMERTGVLIDQDKAMQLAEHCAARRAEIRSAIGFDPMKPDRLARKLFAPEPVGLGYLPVAYGKPSKSFPEGRPVMDKHVLSLYDHPVVDSILEYRGLVKAESTWFQGFLDAVWEDGRVHPDFRQHGTVTTRLSCGGPNMQQLPRQDEEDAESVQIKTRVKEIILAPPGFEVWEFDYSQLEPRLAACYSQDEALIDIYVNERDIYQETADKLGITRYQAKQLFLAIMYGAGKAKTAEMLGVDVKSSSIIVSEFWSVYPGLRATVQAASEAAVQRGWVRLWTGRRRHFKYPSEAHKAFNSILQGGGAEIVKETGLRLRREIPELRIISQVHDSYWFEIDKSEKDSVLPLIQKIMEWPGDEFRVPFPVEGKQLA